jgi:high-affinity nickel-transport protein
MARRLTIFPLTQNAAFCFNDLARTFIVDSKEIGGVMGSFAWGSFGLMASIGFLLGMRHATDADHVIAVSTIVSKERGLLKAGLIGALWGVGHTLTIFAVGIAIILFKIAIPARLGLSMEFSVGLMLILLGVLNLSGVMQRWMSKIDHVHEGISHAEHMHTAPEMRVRDGRLGRWSLTRPLAVGIVHGMAGSAAIALLVMTTIPTPLWQILYILIFGIGTIAGMMLITACIALPISYTSRRFSAWNHRLVYASGLLSLCFGLFVAYQTGIAGGLFTAHPHWTPQ